MCGIVCFASVRRRAIVLRMFESLLASCGMSVVNGAAAAAGAGVGAAAGAAAAWGAAALAWPGLASSTSALTIRPPGPVPLIVARSRPLAAAMRLASGLALMRSSLDD